MKRIILLILTLLLTGAGCTESFGGGYRTQRGPLLTLDSGLSSVTSNIVPNGNNTYNLGAFGNAWKNLFVSSTANLNYVSSTMICLGTDCQTSFPSGAAYAFTPTTNYGETTSATTSPLWIRENLYVSSTVYLTGVSTTGGIYPNSTNLYDLGAFGLVWRNLYASSTAFLSYVSSTAIDLGTVLSGTWNGTSISDAYVDNNITASNYLLASSYFTTTTHATITSIPNLSITQSQISNLTHPFAWTPTVNFGKTYSATSSPVWIRENFAVSSTAFLDYVSSTRINVGVILATTSLQIPASTDPTISALGDFALNSTAVSTSIRTYIDGEEKALYTTRPTCIAFTSTTAQTIGGLDATSTVELGTMFRPETWTYGYCYAKNGTGGVDFTDGDGNATNYMPCTTLTTSTRRTFSSNNTFIMGEAFNLRARLNTGVQQLSICVLRETDPD